MGPTSSKVLAAAVVAAVVLVVWAYAAGSLGAASVGVANVLGILAVFVGIGCAAFLLFRRARPPG